MKNQTKTIRKIVNCLNNPEEEGGYWLPNIQRPFVWSEEQMCRLFDSLMRDYPISTLLIWRTCEDVAHRKFIDVYHGGLRLSDFKQPKNDHAKQLILDGQQRLQSLFIALRGSYEGMELYFDMLSGDLAQPEDIRFKFKFLSADKAAWPWVRFKDLVMDDRKKRLVMDDLPVDAKSLTSAQEERIEDNYDQVLRVFKQEERIAYQFLDDVEYSGMYKLDDVVEIFIRANSGGTHLGKSDLLFSLLSSSWEEADECMEELLDLLNRDGFGFTRDFVLKTCLTILDTGARYNVSKLRDISNRQKIITNWDSISAALHDVKDFLCGKTFIRTDKAMVSYQVLIPIVYARYHFPDQWSSIQNLDAYILRCLLTSAFSGSPDQLIDDAVSKIRESKAFVVDEQYGVIRAANRSLELTRDALLGEGYGSKMVHLLFNLWYRGFDYQPAYSNNEPQVDHIFPQSVLKKVRRANEEGKLLLTKYYAEDRNQLANCMLLRREENGAGNKGSIEADAWLKDKPEEYLEMHLIPRDKELWKLENYEAFIKAREELIVNKFSYLLVGGELGSRPAG